MKIIKTAMIAVFAILAFSAMAASTASAFHPLFFTQSGNELLFSGEGGLALLRGLESALVPGLIDCEKTLIHGFVSNLSTLAHRIVVLFEGKCELVTPAVKAACPPHITTKELLGELGLLTATNHKVVILLVPSDGTGKFASFTCGTNTITVEGTIVGEIPENNAKLEKQINVARTELETKFESVNKNSDLQAITEIYLLETQMTGQELKVTGLLGGGKASEEVSKPNPSLVGDGTVEISTTRI